MNRRDILGSFGGALFFGTFPNASAQTSKSVRRIGSLGLGLLATPAELQQICAPARELGWVEGQNLIVERRWTTNPEMLRPYAEELVRLNVEIITTNGTPATLAAKNATTRIPIVMLTSNDPVRSGLVASLAKPGGNITGYSGISPELNVKRLELLRETLPTAQRVAVFNNPNNPYFELTREENERLYRSLGMQPIMINVAAISDFPGAVAEAARQRAQALVLNLSTPFNYAPKPLMHIVLEHGLPTIAGDRDFVEAGALLSLMPDWSELFKISGFLIDKILRGAKPADLPIQQPTKFVLSINIRTAKVLGVTIPQSLLLRAHEVIA